MATNNKILEFPLAAHRNEGRLLIPERLSEGRIAARMTQTELASRVGVSRQSISYYEIGEKSPEPPILRKISEELSLPIGFFTKEDRPMFGRLTANFFRKNGPDTKRRNQACDVFASWLSSFAFAFDKVANFPAVDLPSFEPRGEFYTEEELENAAEETRRAFGLGLGPISNTIRLLESKGIIIARYKIPNEKIEAFSFWSGPRPFIFLASEKESGARARYDACHELGHIVLHRGIGREDIENKETLKKVEDEANRFAGAFLLPRRSFPNEVYSSRVESFVDLKARWKTSIQAMIYRCKDLGIFDDRQVTNAYKQIQYKKWRTNEPLDKGHGALPFEEPILLNKVAKIVIESGVLSKDELVSELELSLEDMEKFCGVSFSEVKEQKTSPEISLK
ncbi:hypothetical protein DL1_03140 [Thioclava dalianensis]|uniref:HTH cro/C1-type domain-containing protein n=1 Tax=Thioclava dalianensis TaxID=1185766 RepID=A0A074TCU5_9RHOB|nr:XRE family transcriptional regulator [Thioclava dalianensis]KEP69611.1 hypothetical protein DL1_03140 [Thioclava dalianensis]SFN15574.1 Zn-dependent peptidase ImmA, M78 family [Thioclava dalianensis]